MSVAFSLTENSLTRAEWNTVLEEWVEELGDFILNEPRFGDDAAPSALVLGKGSVRGVFIKLEESKATFTLNGMASRADWRLAWELMILIVIKGGGKIFGEDGGEIGLRELTPEKADAMARADLAQSIATFRQAFETRKSSSGVAKLPVGGFRVPLKASDLPKSDAYSDPELERLEKTLSERVRRYTEASHAKTYVLENELRLSSWNLKPTLVTQAHYIVIRQADHPIPIERARAILGERVERIGPDLWYFPGLSGEEKAELLSKLRRATVKVPGFVKPKLSASFVREAIESDDSDDKDIDEPEDIDDDELEDDEDEELVEAPKAAVVEEAPEESAEEEPFVLTELIDGTSLAPEPEAATPSSLDRRLAAGSLKPVIQCLITELLESEEPEKAAERLKRRLGVEDEIMELLLAVSIRALQGLFGVGAAPRSVDSVCEELLESGVPEPLIKEVFAAIYRAS